MLWDHESGTVAEVAQSMNERWEPELARNTVLTYLRILREHGWVRVTVEGRGHRYFPAVPKAHARWLMVEHLVELMFGGTREELLDYLISDRNTSSSTLERVRLTLEGRIGRGRTFQGSVEGGGRLDGADGRGRTGGPGPARDGAAAPQGSTGSTRCDARSADR